MSETPIRRALCIMAKQPAAGRTKTRLCPPLRPDEAAALYAAFLQDIVATCASVGELIDHFTPGVAYAPSPGAYACFQGLAPGFRLVEQRGADLSVRLDGVLRDGLSDGYSRVVAINSDGPTLPPALLVRAFQLLDDPETGLVLGPCEDGGYYLIGVKGEFGGVVRNVTMSTPSVLADTLSQAEAVGLPVALLPEWYDIDDGPALLRLQAELTTLPATVAPATRRLLSALPIERLDTA